MVCFWILLFGGKFLFGSCLYLKKIGCRWGFWYVVVFGIYDFIDFFFVVENWRVKEIECMCVIVDELIKVVYWIFKFVGFIDMIIKGVVNCSVLEFVLLWMVCMCVCVFYFILIILYCFIFVFKN